ncbi:osteomodulin-like, partial [Agrilus planipennis]|uniref:Osteomodulin-like n=1 Tax=Agrilus planipennis TaxID=224129 RepID=A0A7F5RII7_AGRPL
SFLSLSNNSISVIDPAAFDNMPNLRTIETEFNKISMWSPSWFTNSPNIVTVSFAHNKIASLPGNAFANLKGTHELDG